jgi:hypothetical protein
VVSVRLRYGWSRRRFLGRLGALSLSITQTVLVFVGIPLLVVLLVYGAVYGTAARKASKRYRPGRPYTFAPVWFLAASDDAPEGGSPARELGTGEHKSALPPGPVLAQATDMARTDHGETGGASDRW